jgi:hypothetical protein
MGIWLCNHLPWHKWASRKKLSDDSERLTCSCGRMYGMNHNVRTILPWDDVKDLYEGDYAVFPACHPSLGNRPLNEGAGTLSRDNLTTKGE